MESRWNAERQLHDNVRGLLPWSAELWSVMRVSVLMSWLRCSQGLCALCTPAVNVWVTWALVLHSTFLELKLEQTFWKGTSGWSQEAACRAVSELGQLPTRLSVSVLGRVWDWLVLMESNGCSCRPARCALHVPRAAAPHQAPTNSCLPTAKAASPGTAKHSEGTRALLLLKEAREWVMNGAAFAASTGLHMDSGSVTTERWPGGKQHLPFPAFLLCSVLPPQNKARNYLFSMFWCWWWIFFSWNVVVCWSCLYRALKYHMQNEGMCPLSRNTLEKPTNINICSKQPAQSRRKFECEEAFVEAFQLIILTHSCLLNTQEK